LAATEAGSRTVDRRRDGVAPWELAPLEQLLSKPAPSSCFLRNGLLHSWFLRKGSCEPVSFGSGGADLRLSGGDVHGMLETIASAAREATPAFPTLHVSRLICNLGQAFGNCAGAGSASVV